MTTTPLSTHLNEALVHRALVVYHRLNNCDTKTSLIVKSCAFQLTSVSGENYCSEIFVAKVQYEVDGKDLENSFIVKIMLPEIAEVPSNEEKMYSTVLPGIEECLREAHGERGGNKLHAR